MPKFYKHNLSNATVLIEPSLLKFIFPIKQLQPENRLQMADQSHIIDLSLGDELTADDEHRWFFYLIEGKLELLAVNQPPTLLLSSDKRAYHPLFNEGEHKLRGLALTNCKLVRFDKQQFHTLLNHELISGEELETVEMSEIEGNLFNEIMRAFNMGELKLPSLPDIAAKVKKAMKNPNVSVEDISRIVSSDPAIVTRLIHAANGPLNRGVESIDTIHAAVVRLGLTVAKDLIISFSIKQLFTTKSASLSQRMHQLYEHSVDVAAIGFALSKQSGMLSPDHVLLAGLLHEIGVIPILSYIEDTGLLITDDEELEGIIERLKTSVSSMVIRHWGLSNDLLIVVEDYENWQRDSGSYVDTCDMILIAEIYSRLQRHQINGLPKMEQVPAFKKLFPEQQDAGFVAGIFEQAHEEILSVKTLLNI